MNPRGYFSLARKKWKWPRMLANSISPLTNEQGVLTLYKRLEPIPDPRSILLEDSQFVAISRPDRKSNYLDARRSGLNQAKAEVRNCIWLNRSSTASRGLKNAKEMVRDIRLSRL